MSPIQEVSDSLLMAKFNVEFNKFLHSLDDSTRQIIRKNKKLNEMYDLFLDFIIDTSQHLDYKETKLKEDDFNNK
jgi:hypothetical protein